MMFNHDRFGKTICHFLIITLLLGMTFISNNKSFESNPQIVSQQIEADSCQTSNLGMMPLSVPTMLEMPLEELMEISITP